MISLVQKWIITVEFKDSADLNFYYSDNFYSNILRYLAMMEFVGIVTKIEIEKVKE